jgi:hypothetical protein
MSKFFIVFLTLFAIVGIGYRLHVNSTVQVTSTLVTYTDDELGFTLKHLEDAPLTIGYPVLIPFGENPLNVMASTTFLDPSGLNPTPSDFIKEITQNTTVYYIQTSQFEGRIAYSAYFVKDNFILPLMYVWEDVDWTNPTYDSSSDPKFKEFINILRSIKFIHTEQGIYEGIEQGV